jgi:hypothetical protein
MAIHQDLHALAAQWVAEHMDGSNGDRSGQINQKGAGFSAEDPSIGDNEIGNNP